MKIVYNDPDTETVAIITPTSCGMGLHEIAKHTIKACHPSSKVNYKFVDDSFNREDADTLGIVLEPFDGAVEPEEVTDQ